MPTYADRTDISPERTLNEIQAALRKYHAAKFAYMEEAERVTVAFEMHRRRVRFSMPLPDLNEFSITRGGIVRSGNQKKKAHEQAIRQRWRALLLAIKAKLESVESGIESFDEAFMAQLVLPSGQTMAEFAQPQIAAAYETGAMPMLLEATND